VRGDRLVQVTLDAVSAAEGMQGSGLAVPVAGAPRRCQGQLGGSLHVGVASAEAEELGEGERQVGSQHVHVPAGRLAEPGDSHG
jgi:hypothetical protein